jgi:predicted ABC-type ATPase
MDRAKKILIIAGPNGAGKTTFATEFLPREAECPNFINAIVDEWVLVDNAGEWPVFIDEGERHD